MTILSQVVQDERTARMALSMLVEPDDAVTGRLLGELGALELLRLAEGEDAVPGLSTVDAQLWRSSDIRWGSWGEAAGGEEHAEAVVVPVAIAAGEAPVQLDDSVDRLGAAVVRAPGREIREDR